MTLTSQDVLKAFERIRVFQRGEQRAVHKPLLILLALARIAQDAPRMVTFEDIEGTFKNLLAEFGPSSAPNSRHYPFWHLATDGVWQLDGPADFLNRPAGATPNSASCAICTSPEALRPRWTPPCDATPPCAPNSPTNCWMPTFPKPYTATSCRPLGWT